jgi:ribosomal protein L37AE/L43A
MIREDEDDSSGVEEVVVVGNVPPPQPAPEGPMVPDNSRSGGGGGVLSKLADKLSGKKGKSEVNKNQRENLMAELERNSYDCMICVERVRRFHPVWSCSKCYSIFHLNCLRKWANSSADG